MEPINAADLFERYHVPAFQYFRRMTGRPDLAEDLTQELFLTIIRGLHSYRPVGREAGWVFTVAKTVLLKHLRRNRPDEVSAGDVEKLVTASDRVVAIGLTEALRLLSVADREVLLLREVVGLSYAETALATGDSENSVRARLFRTRKQLRARLGGRSGTTASSITKDSL
jgi:RNA polymerase sigma-70 factor (ECF subfamily)